MGSTYLLNYPSRREIHRTHKKEKKGKTIREEASSRPTYSNFCSLSRSRISRKAISISSSSPGPLGTGSSTG